VAAAGGLSLSCYAFMLAPSLGFIDAGELAAAAHTFGIPHPTGYPLFVVLAGLWSQLPFGSVIVRLNAFSALATALAVAVCTDAAWRLLGRAALGPAARGVAACLAGLCFGFNRTVWSNALSVEVYPLHALLLSLVITALARARTSEASRWHLVAFALGLSFSNHMTTVQLLPGLLLAWLSAPQPVGRVRRLPALAISFALGLVPYLYLPWRAAQDPPLNWGEPISLSALLHHVGGADYRGRFLMGIGAFLDALRQFVAGLPAQSGALTLFLAALGLLALGRRDRPLAGMLLAFLLASVGVGAGYAIPDIASYYLLAYLALALLAGFGAAELLARPRARALGTAAAAAAVATLFFANRDVSERGNFLVEDFAENMFRSLGPRAVVISYQWDHWVAPALYIQTVAGRRQDVLVIDKRLLQRGWYVAQLARRQPDACRGAQRELQALLEANSPERIDAFLQALVDANHGTRPIYVTLDVEPSFPAGYRQVPEGLALRLYRPDALPEPDAPVFDDFHYRPFPRRDGWTDRLRQYYALMLMARGTWLEQAGRAAQAVPRYERAFAFEPSPALRTELRARLARARAAP
jgi:hypothetical protein